LSPLPDTI